MRSLLLPVALAALAASLSGCFWWGMEDFDSGGDADDVEEFPLALLGILLIVGAVLVAVNLSSPPGDKRAPPQVPPQAPPTPPPAPSGWQPVPEEPPSQLAPPRKAAKPPAAKARRRQP